MMSALPLGGPTRLGKPLSLGTTVKTADCGATLYIYLHGIKSVIGGASCPGETVLPFDSGLPISSGGNLNALGVGGVEVTVVGYTVPASAVPAGSG